MTWRIELTDSSEGELAKLDQQIARRLLTFLHERIAPLEDPRTIGEALKGSRFGDLWKYRVGDYRIVASIEDDLVLILIVRFGHRKEVYKR